MTPGVLILMQWSLTPCRVSAPGEDWRRPAYPVNKERKEGGQKNKRQKKLHDAAPGCRLLCVWFDPRDTPARFEISCSAEPTKSVPGSPQFEQDAPFGKHNCTGVVGVEAERKIYSINFFCSKWLYHEHNETWPAPRRNRSSLEFFSGGGLGGGWCRGRLLINHLLVCWCKFSPRFEFRLSARAEFVTRDGLRTGADSWIWSLSPCDPSACVWGCLQIYVRIIGTCCLQICSLLCHIYDFSNSASRFVLEKKKKEMIIIWKFQSVSYCLVPLSTVLSFPSFPTDLPFSPCSNNMRRHQQKWKRTCFFLFFVFLRGKGVVQSVQWKPDVVL